MIHDDTLAHNHSSSGFSRAFLLCLIHFYDENTYNALFRLQDLRGFQKYAIITPLIKTTNCSKIFLCIIIVCCSRSCVEVSRLVLISRYRVDGAI